MNLLSSGKSFKEKPGREAGILGGWHVSKNCKAVHSATFYLILEESPVTWKGNGPGKCMDFS